MLTADQLHNVRVERARLLDGADEIIRSVERAGRHVNADEQHRLNGIFERARTMNARINGTEPAAVASHSTFFRALHALALSNGRHLAAETLARDTLRDPEAALVVKAAAPGATTGAAGWAAEIVQTVIGEFIPLLRLRSALFALAEVFPLRGSIRYPRVATGSASGFVAEGGAIPVKANVLESLTLSPFKAAGLVVATRELFERADAWSESVVMTGLSDDIALGVDQVFLSNSAATSAAPAGIFHSSNAASVIAATAGGTAAACATDLQALLTAGASFVRPVLVIHPSAIAAAIALSNSNTFAIIQALTTGRIGTVEVLPAANLPAVDTLALIDREGLLVGGGSDFAMDLSAEATLHMDTAPNADIAVPASGGASMFQSDSIAAAVKLPITWRSKRTSQVQWISGATWC
jgi:HK97 family phage major capsid protein